jgi:hypothetical protein
LDENDDTASTSAAWRNDVSSSCTHRFDQLVAEAVSADLADEAGG